MSPWRRSRARTRRLLQISSDERARVSRIAELFSEEDLTRHLQIMLRTHGELGYRQEQRFHLELGLLKMAHAQRLLPLEQLLSDAAASASGPARTTPRPVLALPHSLASPANRSATNSHRRDQVRCRRSRLTPRAKALPRRNRPAIPRDSRTRVSRATQSTGGSSANVVIMGSAAPAVEESIAGTRSGAIRACRSKAEPKREPDEDRGERRISARRRSQRARQSANAGFPIGKCGVETEGNALIAKVAASSTMIEMSFTGEARRIASAAASGLAGRPIKMLVEPGGAPQAVSAPRRHHQIEWKRTQPSRTRPDRATHAGKVRSRNPHRDRLSGERIRSIRNLAIANL